MLLNLFSQYICTLHATDKGKNPICRSAKQFGHCCHFTSTLQPKNIKADFKKQTKATQRQALPMVDMNKAPFKHIKTKSNLIINLRITHRKTCFSYI